MSLILDALNRADNERKNQDTVPGLNTVHPAPVAALEEKNNDRKGLYIAISLSIVALAASVYWFVTKPGSISAAKERSSQLQQEKMPAAYPAPSAAPILAPQPKVEMPLPADHSVEQSVMETKSAESVIAPKPTAAVEQLYIAPATQTIPANSQVTDLYAAEESPASESIEDPFAGSQVLGEPTHITNTGRVATEATPSRTYVTITNVQDFNELPWNTKQQIPTISYQRHNFLAGGVSTVVINGQTLGVGNIAASSQLIVQEIFADGIVLKRGDVIFKLRALNGWINM